ncbi:hypothetical protein INT47_008099 [Mucor saturninus]|uniref:C2H2-type domain-containing protein n=1 Tax=Mucor saturninus TaxID=64648 RepID=A0A8H7R0D1_9FUNG|nr:hypothetical protein INT47_008099 [Mucor saturninus]
MILLTPSQENTAERLDMIETLKSFLATAPNGQEDAIKQHVLSTTGESITCVRWKDAFYITGTDIVRCLVFRFYAFGRPVQNLKKFEEGIFSDLRNLKPGTDAILEEPKSAFLDLLFKNNCIRTQKKQKVFFWYSVPHDRLFLDALERDLKREKLGIYPTSVSVANPAESISLDTTQAMFDDFRKSMLTEMNLQPFYSSQLSSSSASPSVTSESCSVSDSSVSPHLHHHRVSSSREGDLQKASSAIFGQFSLFEGSPTYKQRRRRSTQKSQQEAQSKYIRTKKSATNTTNTTIIPDSNTNTTAWSSDTSNTNTDDDSTHVRYFYCPLNTCGKYFKRLEHMKRHLRTHTMERPYLCDLCGKRFSRSDNLAQHKKTHQRLRGMKTLDEEDDDEDDSSSSDERHYVYNGKVSKTSSSIGRRLVNTNTGKGVTSIRRAVDMTSINYRSNGKRLTHNKNNNNNNNYKHSDDLWSPHDPNDNIEYMKAEPPQLLIVPELSISTASTASSCESSPIYTRTLPTIKVEDTELFYDLSSGQQQMNDTAMMMEELLPQPNQYWQDNESASDWQRRVDWDQYSTIRPSGNYDTGEDLIIGYQDIQSYYYLHHPYAYPPASSPLFGPTSNTTASNSTVTTAANSPVTRAFDLYPYSENPTMTPSDALLH